MTAMRLFAFAAALMLAIPPARAEGYDHRGLARQAMEAHIRPGYERLAETAARLVERAGALCDTPSQETLAAAREGFGRAVADWSRMEHLRFGPAAQAHRYERMAFWPDPRGIGRRQVWNAIRKKDESVLDPASLAEKSVALQGLTALEMTLHYGKGANALAAGGEASAFRCGYALAIARNLRNIAGEMRDGWSEGSEFTRTWLDPGPGNNIYRKESEVTLELVKAYGYGLEIAKDVKLAAPLGMRGPGGKPGRPQYAEAGLSISSLVAGIEGVKHLYEKGGLRRRFAHSMPGMAGVIDAELENVLRLASGIALDGPEAFTNEETKGKLAAMTYPLQNANETGGGAMGQAAGLAMGFNAGDGD